MKTILVTGGTGFLGQALVQQLGARGDHVIVLSRQALPTTDTIRHIQSLSEIKSSSQIDACINLAGEPLFNFPWTHAKRQSIWTSRIGTTTAVGQLNMRLDQKMSTLISGSASGIYGDKGDDVVTESSMSGDQFGAALCSAWEFSANENTALGTRVCLLRTGIVIGNGGALLPMLPLFKLGLGAPLGKGQQLWPWIHIDDWVSATLFCLDHATLSGPVNMSAPTPIKQSDFTQLLASVLHRPAWLPGIPAWLLKIATRNSSQLLMDSVNMQPRVLIDQGFNWQTPSCREALEKAVMAPKN